MRNRATTPMALRDFRASLHGEVILPDDDGYDSARQVWNGMIDNYPALIIRCANRADVTHAVGFGRLQHLPVAVRGGGHSVCGKSVCDEGIVIDLSQMKGIRVDLVTCTARAEAGLTLGGGLGWFMGKYGLTIDNLLSVDMVTADGRVLRASETSHPDLFWGLRGGGGNFGIVTSFDFQLHAVGAVLAGKVVYPLSRAREVLRFYREYTSSVPDELTAYACLMTTPDGVPAIAITLCSCGSLAAGERLVEPVRKFGSPLVDLIRPQSYLKVLLQADAGAPDGRHYYEKARTLRELSDEAIEAIVDYGAACTSPSSVVLIQHLHGAASRVSPPETAFALREQWRLCQLPGPRGRRAGAGGVWRQLRTVGRAQEQV